jgi:hypothetical protein
VVHVGVGAHSSRVLGRDYIVVGRAVGKPRIGVVGGRHAGGNNRRKCARIPGVAALDVIAGGSAGSGPRETDFLGPGALTGGEIGRRVRHRRRGRRLRRGAGLIGIVTLVAVGI